MSTPHKCPVCDGNGQIGEQWDIGGNAILQYYQGERCHACGGTGVVWEPSQQFYPVDIDNGYDRHSTSTWKPYWTQVIYYT